MPRTVVWLLVLLAALVPRAALAQGLEVSPVQVFLTGRGQGALLKVRNATSEARRYQVSAVAWGQDSQGEMKLVPTKELALFPLLLTLQAGESRNIRVGATVPQTAVEQTYRVFVEELPSAPKAGEATVRVLTRVGVPVFLAPSAYRKTTRLSAPAVRGDTLGFELTNSGSVHVRPSSIALYALGSTGERLFEHRWQPWYVLAGGRRVYEVAVPAASCAKVRTLRAEVQLGEETQVQEVSVPKGACAR